MTIDKFSEEIHLESSFIFFISEDRIDQCRVNIKTILRNETKNKNYFLVKECRAEAIDKNPFKNHSGRYEYLGIVHEKALFLRHKSFGNQINSELPIEYNDIKINSKKVKLLKNTDVVEILKKRKEEKIFCKINFNFENFNYSIISECEYINFPGPTHNNKQEFLQPILGYIPFIINGKIYVSYVVTHVADNIESDLDILVRDKFPIYTHFDNNLVKNCIKLVLNKLLFFLRKNEFEKYISVKSKIQFYTYIL